jgi:hypothetical protein
MTSHISQAVREELPKLNGDKAQRVRDVAAREPKNLTAPGRENDGPEGGLHRSTRLVLGLKR